MLGIKLVHGWIVEKTDEAYSVLSKYSYNEAVNKIALMNDILHKKTKTATETTTQTNSTEVPTTEFDLSPSEKQILEEGKILDEWINNNSTQLTYAGVIGIHEQLKSGELAVFFRNNHFSTLLKKDNNLYLLVTDQGYLEEKKVVWEVLNEVGGDTQLVDSIFNLCKPSVLQLSQLEQFEQKHGKEQLVTMEDDDIDLKVSVELAKKEAALQMQEDEALAVMLSQELELSEKEQVQPQPLRRQQQNVGNRGPPPQPPQPRKRRQIPQQQEDDCVLL